MKTWKPLVILTALLYCTGMVMAQDSSRQKRANLTIRVASFAQAADDLREITDQFDATVQNLNLHRENDSGNASVRVAPGQFSEVVRELANMGLLENENQSLNDFTTSLQQYQRRVKVFQQLQQVDMNSTFSKLPKELRGDAETEYRNWVKGQIDSAENSLRSYSEQASYAEISISFTKDPEAKTGQGENPRAEVTPVVAPPKQAPPTSGRSPSPEFFLLCLINILGLWLIYRKIDSNVVGLRD